MRRPKHLGIIILSIILVAIIIFSVLYLNSYSIALRRAGFHPGSTLIVDTGFDDNGKEYRAVADYTATEDAKLAYMVKGSLGFWKVAYMEDRRHPDTGMLALSWGNFPSIRRFAPSDVSVTEYAFHQLYLGNNAVDRIDIPEEQLPENVTVSIYQAGNLYMLHFTGYTLGDVPRIDCYGLLKALKCIA